jgi:hypothetical protein
VGAGVVGGIAYNSSQTKVIPVVEAVKKELKPALKSDAFVALEVITMSVCIIFEFFNPFVLLVGSN